MKTPREAKDLTDCDREPIHLIGSIQNFGALLVLEPESWLIIQASENIGSFLVETPVSLIGRRISDVLGSQNFERMQVQLFATDEGQRPKPLKISIQTSQRKKHFTALIHLSKTCGRFIVEIENDEENDQLLSFIDFYDEFSGSISKIQQTTSVVSLCETLVEEIKSITHFDRVWIHKITDEVYQISNLALIKIGKLASKRQRFSRRLRKRL